MANTLKRLGWAATLLVALTACGLWMVQRWVGTDDMRSEAERKASDLLGVPVKFGHIGIDIWPLPSLAVTGVRVESGPALTLRRLELRPAWGGLLQGRLELATLLLHEVYLPQGGIDALLSALEKRRHATLTAHQSETGSSESLRYLPTRTVLDNLTWVSTSGTRLTMDADVRLSRQGLPDHVSIHFLKGAMQGGKALLQRDDNVWTLDFRVGGGTISGSAQLQPALRRGAKFSVNGRLETRAVEVAALTNTNKPVLSGRLDADTSFSGQGANLATLAQALQTQSQFNVRQAVVHGIDLAKAVKTIGLNRGGETRLDTLAGHLTTRGRAIQLTNLVASSGILSASGNVAVAPSRALSGRISVDLAATAVGSAVAVPLVVGGTLDAPELTLTRAALIGAALGTAVMPGVGTGAGATLGDKVGEGLKNLFGK